MGWIPTKEEIEKEANNYRELGFFGKAKNVLFSFIIVCCGIWFYAGAFTDGVTVAIYLTLALFIYLNHRWAIAVFAIMALQEGVTLFTEGSEPLVLVVFGVVATLASYRSYRVATQLKKNANAKID